MAAFCKYFKTAASRQNTSLLLHRNSTTDSEIFIIFQQASYSVLQSIVITLSSLPSCFCLNIYWVLELN